MDKVADMLSMIKNANMAKKDTVVIPFSRFRHDIANCLEKNGFIRKVLKRTDQNENPVLEIGLISFDDTPRITNLRRISSPARRTYIRVKDIYPVKDGYGILVLSTPKGILSDKEAKKEHVGGEALFEIW